jgi:hypothetical protein
MAADVAERLARLGGSEERDSESCTGTLAEEGGVEPSGARAVWQVQPYTGKRVKQGAKTGSFLLKTGRGVSQPL